jgi:type III secretion control protein HpaP
MSCAMPIIEPRPLRIIAAELDARERTARSGGSHRFDYAALARRVRAKPGHVESRADEDASGSHSDAAAEDRLSGFREASGDDANESETHAPVSGQSRSGSTPDLSERIARTTLPVVDAMYRTQGQFIQLAATLANEVAAFCADPSITSNGNWNVQLPLDSKIVPDTVLYLSLSPFHLSLRFDTQSARSRQLLLDHSSLLQRELDALLRAWGAARDIELTVW